MRRWLTVLGIDGPGLTYVRVIWFTPVERFEGAVQKLFYLHVPAAWTAMLAFGITGVLSFLVLVSRHRHAGRWAAASAEVGLVLSVVVLTTGATGRNMSPPDRRSRAGHS